MSLKGYVKRKKYFKENPIVYSQYKELIRDNMTEKGLSETKYMAIKRYAIEHTLFYKDYMPDDVFPIMTKTDYIKHHDEIRSDEKFDKPLHIISTSGSTGIPFSVEQNYEKRARLIAELKYMGKLVGYQSHEKMLQLRAYHGIVFDRKVDKRENIWRYDICNMSDRAIEEIINWILIWKPRTIYGYASAMETICDYIIRSKNRYQFKTLKSVGTSADMLTPECAGKINKVFDCLLYDRYADMEMGMFAQRIYGQTNFILNKSSYYFEILKIDSDEPADEGETGRIVVTDFYNRAFPMIRYDTGDLGIYCIKDGEMQLKEVLGRRIDSIYSVNGNLISPHAISRKMLGLKNILQWQFVQKGTTEYLLRLNSNGKVDEIDILKRLHEVLGESANIKVQYEDDIPLVPNSQKRRYIINEMSK